MTLESCSTSCAHRLVQASVSETVAPQAAVVGFAISDQFEIVFDTLASAKGAEHQDEP
jgi:hypothetical protein